MKRVAFDSNSKWPEVPFTTATSETTIQSCWSWKPNSYRTGWSGVIALAGPVRARSGRIVTHLLRFVQTVWWTIEFDVLAVFLKSKCIFLRHAFHAFYSGHFLRQSFVKNEKKSPFARIEPKMFAYQATVLTIRPYRRCNWCDELLSLMLWSDSKKVV